MISFFTKRFWISAFMVMVLFQVTFALASSSFTAPRHEAKLYATLGIVFDTNDLHKLNEAAHYFGQTLIGWTKFPRFKSGLLEATGLPESVQLRMSAQERQNFIFSLQSPAPISEDQVQKTFDYLGQFLNEYNQKTKTRFVLSNTDFEIFESTRSYGEGAFLTLIASLILIAGVTFLHYEVSRR